jgi:hypothetical protein
MNSEFNEAMVSFSLTPGWVGLRASRVPCYSFHIYIFRVYWRQSEYDMTSKGGEGLSIPENSNVGKIVESTNEIEADAGENGKDSKILQHKGR